ncbi:hypothetical protein XENORESO_014192 [Xenotaenia resolanae]|uniref:Uncharacterized protein n=1 Tax=Xenotaenia resolanae TaxID=208358 RepID=A0ABV0WNU4_9TELE
MNGVKKIRFLVARLVHLYKNNTIPEFCSSPVQQEYSIYLKSCFIPSAQSGELGPDEGLCNPHGLGFMCWKSHMTCLELHTQKLLVVVLSMIVLSKDILFFSQQVQFFHYSAGFLV